MWILWGENKQAETISLSNQYKCRHSQRFKTCRWLESTGSISVGGTKNPPQEPSLARPECLVVFDGDYFSLWLDQPSLSRVFSAAVCGLIESERLGGSEETRWLTAFLWSVADWHVWLCGRRQLVQILPRRSDFSTPSWRGRRTGTG